MAKLTASADFGELRQLVKSKILERIAENFRLNRELAASTMYTKSDGTNYGMYQKSDDFSALGDIWERVFATGQLATQGSTAVQVKAETKPE